MEKGKVNVVLGLQRGDEGKGRVVDLLANDHDLVARYNGGHNAGHTIVTGDGAELSLHQIPSGIAYGGKLNIIGKGVLLEPVELLKEIRQLQAGGIRVTPDNLALSDQAALSLPHHTLQDCYREMTQAQQGSTKRGIAQAAADKYRRTGAIAEVLESPDELRRLVFEGLLEAGQLRRAYTELASLRDYIDHWIVQAGRAAEYLQDTDELVNSRLEAGESILAEGAQAFGLDIEHGPSPMTTSSHTTPGGAMNGLGFAHQYLERVIGVAKLVKSHVGGGPLVTEIYDDENDELALQVRGPSGEIDSEYGKSTGRPRRIGYPDLPELRRAVRLTGATELALTKLDHLRRYGSSVLVAVGYELDGEILHHAPNSLLKLQACKPVYEEFGLWGQDANLSVSTFGELPRPAKRLIEFIEDETNVPVRYIGTGPARHQIIDRG
jgi:adenylosuccinate synthase